VRKFLEISAWLSICLTSAAGLLCGQTIAPASIALPGQIRTLLPDGRWMDSGGSSLAGVSNAFSIEHAVGQTSRVTGVLARARAWHTATVLPQGKVLILGGIDGAGVVDLAELLDPDTLQSQPLFSNAPTPRAHHTATVLSDGLVLIVGGIGGDGKPLPFAELWEPQSGGSEKLESKTSILRRDHSATLLPDGKVLLWGGFGEDGSPLRKGELYDPDTKSFSPIDQAPWRNLEGDPHLEASLPTDRQAGVSVGTIVSLRFSRLLNVATVNARTIKLLDDSQLEINAKVIPAENGLLAFLTPNQPLLPSRTYTVSIDGPTDNRDMEVTPATISFTTMGAPVSSANVPSNISATSTNEPSNIPPLQGPAGVTSLSGRVLLSSNAKPVQGVSLQLLCGATTQRTQSDVTGRFLITSIPSGHCKLEIDGRPNSVQKNDYGEYYAGVDITSGVTNVLSYFIWLTELDAVHAITIPSPTTSQVEVSTPLLPGLRLTLPPGTVITDQDGNVVHRLSITPVPLSRTPFPLPNVPVTFYFTIQPGGAYIRVNGGDTKGAQLIYPNTPPAPVGARFDFWNYDPDEWGWYVYGQGSVSADRRSIVPDPGVVLYEFTGAMATSPGNGPPNGPGCSGVAGCKAGEPVDLGTGMFVLNNTDLYLDGVLPIQLTRVYRPGDSMSRAFGIGATHDYNVFLAGDSFPYTFMDLVLADGKRIHYPRISTGTGNTDAIYEHTATQTVFYKSQISWNGTGWNLRLKDGSVWMFPDAYQLSASQGAVISIADRNGNALTMNRDPATGNLTRVTSTSGRWISFTYDLSGRITQAQDNALRSISYTYDTGGRLSRVVDAKGGTTQYTYDGNNELLTITDARAITYLTNKYDASGRVIEQDLADGGVYQFAYTTDTNGNIIQTKVTNPRGYVQVSTFDTSGYMSGGNVLSYTRAAGQSEQQTTTYQYQSSLMSTITDPLGRQTSFAYDSCGNTTSIARMTGTANAVTTMTYQTGSGTSSCIATFNQVTSITDPLNHTTTLGYDATGSYLTSVTDPLNTVSITQNADGQPASIANFAGTTQFGYSNHDLIAVTDPAGNTIHRTLDAVGHLAILQAPVGQLTQYQRDQFGYLSKIVDPLNGQTSFAYDANENLITVQDAAGNTTTYSPDSMDRVASRTDALLKMATYQYDLNGNLSALVDRKNQVTSLTYDGLDRPTSIQYADQSTVTNTYDAGNRLTQVVDSIAGTITRNYDDLDDLISEVSPQGSVSYTYDSGNRRTSMTVAGQPTVSYTYDNGNRLIQIAQGTATVTIGYDGANRRTSLTLPNGIVAAYGYDAASRLSSITYTQGSITLGNLSYAYDGNGRLVQMGGSLAAVNLPGAVASAVYNANNQLTQWGSATLTYDLNGNLTSDGTNSYTWNARNQLGALGGGTFAYDGFGRRTQNANGTAFLYDGVNQVQELSGSAVTANLLTGLGVDEILTRTDSAGERSFLTDALGSSVALTDLTGAIQTRYVYQPFGNSTANGSVSTNSYEYTGRENDGTGLYFYRARYYDPPIGRFISEDPAGLAGGDTNLYAYVFDSPTNFFDPHGLDGWTRFWGGVRAVGGGFETAAGAGLAVTTGWTGVGGVAGVAVGIHGLDQVQAGLRQAFTDCPVDSMTSQGLQAVGLSQSVANGVDAGLSVAGSLGAGTATQAIRAGGLGNVGYYEIGQKTLPGSSYARYGQIGDAAARGQQIVADQGWLRAILPDVTGQWGRTIGTGTTPLGTGVLGASGAIGTLSGGRSCGCH